MKTTVQAGNLLYTDKDGNKQATVFYNTGNACRKVAELFGEFGNAVLEEKFMRHYNLLLEEEYGVGAEMDRQGFVTIPENE